MKTAAYVLSLIGCIFGGFLLIYPIIMTVKIKKAIDNGTRLSTGFKVCHLIFTNLLAGIFLLCDKTI